MPQLEFIKGISTDKKLIERANSNSEPSHWSLKSPSYTPDSTSSVPSLSASDILLGIPPLPMARFNDSPMRLAISVCHGWRGSRAQLGLFSRAAQVDLFSEPSQLDYFATFFVSTFHLKSGKK